MNKDRMCDCRLLARTFDEILISKHHPTCEFRKIEEEAKEHIEKLIKALENEASMGDGISEEFYVDYINAKYFIGQKVKIIEEEEYE